MHYSTQEYSNVIHLRQQRKSYLEIQKLTGIPKSTLSDWLSNEQWSVNIKKDLTAIHLKNYKLNLIKALEVIAERKRIRHESFRIDAKILYEKLKRDPLFLFGLGIYWGEGNKKSGNMVAVTNTDPNILRIMVKFYRKCLKVDESKLRIALFVYKDINIEFAIEFWSELLQVPKTQFIKVQILESKAKLTKTKSKYGICSLYFSNTEFHIKILEWIKLLSLENAGIA